LPEATEHDSRHHAQENQRNQDFDEREARLFRIAYHRCVEALSYGMIKMCKKVGWEAENPRGRALSCPALDRSIECAALAVFF
jgi:hypothetical protein